MRTPRERLLIFLCILTREHLPSGTIERILEDHVEGEERQHRKPVFSSPQVESLANDWADRLIGKEEPAPEYRFGLFSVLGAPISKTSYPTAEVARSAKAPSDHVRRGRIVERKSVFDDRIEWEAEPYE